MLVKRWKKLPPGTQRDWRHVVDARAGPGTKAVKTSGQPPSSNGKQGNSTSSPLSFASHKRLPKPKKRENAATDDLVIGELLRRPAMMYHLANRSAVMPTVDDTLSEHSPELSRIPSPDRSDESDMEDEDYLSESGFAEESEETSGKRKLRSRSSSKNGKKCNSENGHGKRTAAKVAMKCVKNSSISSFLDMSFWRK